MTMASVLHRKIVYPRTSKYFLSFFLMAMLLSELPLLSAQKLPNSVALTFGAKQLSYATLAENIGSVASGILGLGIKRGERVALYLDKRFETVIAAFGAAHAGAVFVPINPLLKAEQVGHILRDCNVRALVTTRERIEILATTLTQAPDLKHLVSLGGTSLPSGRVACHDWESLLGTSTQRGYRVIDTDMVSILYTSGSTGKPKGVVLSHRNMVAGAESVSSYLENSSDDTLLSALPLSFDAGFSQLTTAFTVGARVVLLNYLLPRDVLNALEKENVTGLTAVPPLWIQLSQLDWNPGITEHLRYIANTGGRMPRETLEKLRSKLPKTKPFLMYGLTEAFRSTYLPPEEVDKRPDSIGKAIPNAEILVLRPDGTECNPDEPGELVHRGALVSMGYWNDAEKTAERFKLIPIGVGGREEGMMIPEVAVFSGDTVRRDADGFLYFIGRQDEMIKTSGYRISPMEIEEALYNTQLIGEVAAFGIPHPVLGHAIVVVATPKTDGNTRADQLLSECRTQLPTYMIPAKIDIRPGPLPRNPNGKIDRKLLASEYLTLFEQSTNK